MATYSSTESARGRKFAISRKNGQQDKNGRPFFFEWLPELPANQQPERLFETRTRQNGVAHYELFAALDGYLTNIDVEAKFFNGTERAERWLVLELVDNEGQYKVEVGKLDSRWAIDAMKRLLDYNFDPRQKLRIAPYAFQDGDRWNMGVACMSGMDGKLSAKHTDEHLAGMPQPDMVKFKGETQYDFSPVSEWLLEQLEKRVKPRLLKDPLVDTPKIETNIRPTEKASEFPQTEPAFPDGDDLPF
jgi:hypothetical protein